MYVLFAFSCIALMWAWWAALPGPFFAIASITIMFLTTSDIKSMYAQGLLYNTAIRAMTRTDCCLIHEMWSKPDFVKWATILLRAVSGLAAVIACATSWFDRERFLSGHYFFISCLWSATVVLWLISCLPMFVCLIQCAANPKYAQVAAQISSKEIIMRFRKVYSLWLLHDIVLGIFWLYLSVMLYDLSDDEDDSEWRTIFLSMLSWHILVIALNELYMHTYYSLNPVVDRRKEITPCCGPRNAQAIWSFMTIISFAGMYVVVILRMHNGSLLKMGTESVLTPLIFSASQILFVVSKSFQRSSTDDCKHKYPSQKAKTPTTLAKTRLDQTALDF